jgi:predicted PurR-regulated permease PerM
VTAPLAPADARPPVPRGVRTAAAWSWRLLSLAAALYVVALLITTLSLLFTALAAALLLAGVLQPAVARATGAGAPRVVSASLVLVSFVAVLGGAAWFIGRAVSDELDDLRRSLAEGIDRVRDWLVEGPVPVGNRQLDEAATSAITWVQDNDDTVTTGVLTAASTATNFLTGVLLSLFILFFLLYDGRTIWSWLVRLLPADAREPVDGAGRQAWSTLVAYTRGIIVVAVCDAVLVAITLTVLDVPLVLPLAALTFFGAFIPVIGAALAGTAAVLVALVDEGLTVAVLVAVAVLVVQFIDGDVLQPLVVGRAVDLHPLAVGLAVTAGALLAGVGGAVVAVPLMATVNAAVVHLSRRGAEPAPAVGEAQ